MTYQNLIIMQENKLITTIKGLYDLGQYQSIVSLSNSLKEAHDFALSLLKKGAIQELEALNIVKDEDKAVSISNSLYREYDKNWSIKNKVQYILKQEKRFLHFREIARIIVSIEGEGDENELTSSLSNSTRPLKEDKIIVKYKYGKSHRYTFWGSPKWLDDKGEIKKEYMFDLNYIDSDSNDKNEQVDLFAI